VLGTHLGIIGYANHPDDVDLVSHAQLLFDGLRQQRVLDLALDGQQQVQPRPGDIMVFNGWNLGVYFKKSLQ
jgi:hypothetical protein